MSPERSVFVTVGVVGGEEGVGGRALTVAGPMVITLPGHPPPPPHPYCGPLETQNVPFTCPSPPPQRLARGSKHTLC